MKTFDERSEDYSQRINLHPDTWKGDVETAYTVACSEQFDIDRKIYTPYINYLQQALDVCIRLLLEQANHVTYYQNMPNIKGITDDWKNGADNQLGSIPYMFRQLPNGTFMETEKERLNK